MILNFYNMMVSGDILTLAQYLPSSAGCELKPLLSWPCTLDSEMGLESEKPLHPNLV